MMVEGHAHPPEQLPRPLPKINNPFNARRIDRAVPLGRLKLIWESKGTVEEIPKALHRRHDNGKFLRVETPQEDPERHTVIVGSDGGILAYLVPASYIRNTRQREGRPPIPDLYNSIERIRVKKKIHKGAYRGEALSRHYLVHSNYRAEPMIWSEYGEDGEEAVKFMEESQELWNEATRILRSVLPGKYEDLLLPEFPEDMPRMAGVWSGCAVNIGSPGKPVKTALHRDVGESPFVYSCLTAFGDYTGADVELWEAEVVVQLRPGDLLFFPDALIHHSNTNVSGVRHSCVAFTPKSMYDWWKRVMKSEGEHKESRAQWENFCERWEALRIRKKDLKEKKRKEEKVKLKLVKQKQIDNIRKGEKIKSSRSAGGAKRDKRGKKQNK